MVSGCSADSSDSAGSAPAVGLAEPQQEGGAGKADADQAGTAAQVKLRVDERAIVYTGSIRVRVKDLDKAADSVTSMVTTAGGFVGGDKRSADGSDDGSGDEASLTLRIPAAKFAGVVDELAALGKQLSREISTEDVTEETLDLDARLASQRARVDSGRRLLAQAKSLTDLVMLEGELAKREADLASLEAKKRRLSDLTALSTITVTLLGPLAEDEPETDPGFLDGLKGGWNSLVASVQVLLVVVGALLPWLIALGVPAYGLVRLARWARRRRPGPPPAVALAPLGSMAPPLGHPSEPHPGD
jgi:hypothetical protein